MSEIDTGVPRQSSDAGSEMDSREAGIVLREASHTDAEILLEWRNDPETRRHARSQGLVGVEEHLEWLTSSLADPDRILLIAEGMDGSAIGTVRFDFLGHDRNFEVSITIAPECRGRQLSASLLKASESWLTQRHGACIYRAFIMLDNPASIRLFERSGYARTSEDTAVHGSWWEKPLPEKND